MLEGLGRGLKFVVKYVLMNMNIFFVSNSSRNPSWPSEAPES